MTTYAFPTLSVGPSEVSVEYSANTAVSRSPLSRATQTVARDGDLWEFRITYQSLRADDKAVAKAFFSKLRGNYHRFTVRDFGNTQRGAFGGTPLVAGANQTGTSIDIDGASTGITNWIRAGDMFSVNGELKMCTDDANSDGSGNVTINFVPPLRRAPADNAVITTTDATGTFMLIDNVFGWTNRPGDFVDMTIICSEDINA